VDSPRRVRNSLMERRIAGQLAFSKEQWKIWETHHV
jgi:hypothetical protein